MYSCTFIGHSDCLEDLHEDLKFHTKKLIVDNNVKKFYVGTHVKFDRLVYEVLCELQKDHNIEVIVILAYLNKTAENLYYSRAKTIFPDILEKTPLRFAIHKRNQFMISQSQYMICFLNHTFSNSYTFVKKALRKINCYQPRFFKY